MYGLPVNAMCQRTQRSVSAEQRMACLQVLQAQSQTIVQPSDRSNLHPLVIPLSAQSCKNGESVTTYTCLLRQVTLSGTNDQVCISLQANFWDIKQHHLMPMSRTVTK